MWNLGAISQLILVLLLCFSTNTINTVKAQEKHTINILDYGVNPSGQFDSVLAFKEAIKHTKTLQGEKTIVFL